MQNSFICQWQLLIKNISYNNHKKYIKKRRKYSCHYERKGYKFKDFTWKPQFVCSLNMGNIIFEKKLFREIAIVKKRNIHFNVCMQNGTV